MSKTGSSPRVGGAVARRSLLAGAALVPTLAGCSMFEDDEKPMLAGHRTDVLSSGGKLEIRPYPHYGSRTHYGV